MFADICEGAWSVCLVLYWCEQIEGRMMFREATYAESGDPWLLDQNSMVILSKSKLEGSFMRGGTPGHIDLKDPQLWECLVISHWIGVGFGSLSGSEFSGMLFVLDWLRWLLSSVFLDVETFCRPDSIRWIAANCKGFSLPPHSYYAWRVGLLFLPSSGYLSYGAWKGRHTHRRIIDLH